MLKAKGRAITITARVEMFRPQDSKALVLYLKNVGIQTLISTLYHLSDISWNPYQRTATHYYRDRPGTLGQTNCYTHEQSREENS